MTYVRAIHCRKPAQSAGDDGSKAAFILPESPRVIEYRRRKSNYRMTTLAIAPSPQFNAHFMDTPVRFEACAAKIAELMMPQISSMDIHETYARWRA